jgi:phthiodiolone/phenolphthiodiolone dimycocerosates ketoreductase
MELIMMAVDPFRRAPTILAQQILGIDHLSKGRASFFFGAGEAKQFAPYGLSREKPFAHLEEMLKVVRMLINSKGQPVNYDGPIWKLDHALLVCPPYENTCPRLMVVGGPGKPIEFASRLGDGWGAYVPACGSPAWYANCVRQLHEKTIQNGRDPQKLKTTLVFVCLIEETEEAVERALRNPAIRWDVAAFVPSTETWKEAGFTNPFGDAWSYSRDLIPTKWSREDALKIIEQVPPEAVRALRMCGTPEQVAKQIQPYIEAGCNHACVVNYAGLVGTGNWAAGATGSKVMDETFAHLRRLNGQPQPVVRG